MKKLVLAVLAVVLMVAPAYAGLTTHEMYDYDFSGKSDRVNDYRGLSSADRVTFFVTWDRTAATACATGTVTASMSVDGTNWEDIHWFDVAGGLVPQTSETLGADNTYIGFIDPIMIAPYIRIWVGFEGDETTSSANVKVTIVEDK